MLKLNKTYLLICVLIFIVLFPKIFRSKINKIIVEIKNFNPNREKIETGWHVIEKNVIEGKEFLYNYNAKKGEEGKSLPGGYIENIDQNLILGTNGKGETFLYSFLQNKFKPLNSNLNEIYNRQKFDKYITKWEVGTFGIKDIYLDRDKKEIYASITKNITGDGCYGMAIYKAKLDNLNFQNLDDYFLHFKEFFQTDICNREFNGHRTGGRIKKNKDKIIFTVGDLGIYLNNEHPNAIISPNKKNLVGQVLLIDEKGKSILLSTGHRNPQGLEIVGEKIFITEHGPQGGDEINLIKKVNSNYGWPLYVYGFSYKDKLKYKFPHEGQYLEPIFYFTPSIGISEIIFYEKNEFPLWKNKFLLTSLKDSSIYLMDFDDDIERFKSVEKISIGQRIRDINVLPNGELVLITDNQKIITLRRSKEDRVDLLEMDLYKLD